MSYKINDTLLYLSKELSKITDSPALEAEIILCYFFNISKEDLIKNNNKQVSSEDFNKINRILKKRMNNTPLEYITRTKNFYMHQFNVDKNVLIPRPETETLVDKVLEELRLDSKNEINILEIGIGSGCIFISIADQLNTLKGKTIYNFYLTDISERAIKIAKLNQANILPYSTKITFKFIKADIIPNDLNIKLDYIISNPPYIPSAEIPTLTKEVQNEPLIALDGGKTGLDIYEDILEKTSPYKSRFTKFFFEIHSAKAPELTALCKKKLKDYKFEIIKDLNGLDRIIKMKQF